MYAQSKRGVLEKVVGGTFLDRRKAAPMAVSIDQPGEQQLSTITEDRPRGWRRSWSRHCSPTFARLRSKGLRFYSLNKGSISH